MAEIASYSTASSLSMVHVPSLHEPGPPIFMSKVRGPGVEAMCTAKIKFEKFESCELAFHHSNR